MFLVDSASKLGIQFESVLKETNKSKILVWSYLNTSPVLLRGSF